MDAELYGIFRIFCARLHKSLLTGKDLLRLNHQTVGLVLVITEACSKVFGISKKRSKLLSDGLTHFVKIDLQNKIFIIQLYECWIAVQTVSEGLSEQI
jgi:hypothetical protein